METVRFFLGANTPQGFYSLYDQLIDRDSARAVYILKGGPGCGKSTLMRQVAQRAEKAGLAAEYILCSGDPSSLDALVLPALGAAIVDGTAPHVVEPVCPGAVEHYVNLGASYDTAALAPMKAQLRAGRQDYQACYQRAYRYLSAADRLGQDDRALLAGTGAEEKMRRRAAGILSREVRKKRGAAMGGVRQRFLSGVTCRGVMLLTDTAFSLCPKIYHLCDRYGLAHTMLSELLTGVREAGYDAVVCPSPMDPLRLEHLLVPELGLGFLSCPGGTPMPAAPYRRVHIDAMLPKEVLSRNRGRLRLSGHVADTLMQEGVQALAQAKQLHDELEALYNPHVNFDLVERTAQDIIKALGL